ncbi:MAG: hypothetical protein GF383_04210 [Candidatus Lokiarchaeota archaeon]|nr:hypothetical protein [Candidatus Lokiarchaeota archaeon]MBD3338958.1 hypothetical protein [Candidatus Lokiarchaeota archaeon]
MKSEKGCGIGPEFPHSHKLEAIFIMLFVVFWLLDMHFFKFHIKYGIFFIDFLRYFGFINVLAISFFLIIKSWKVVSPKVYNSETLLTDGVFSIVRHPMYLGIILVYLSFVVLNLSLIMLMIWLFIFFIFNIMASYEEKRLVEIFGKDYLRYKKMVSRWIPVKYFIYN